MKYIALLNRFWQLHNEQAFQPGESHLYYSILNQFNAKGKNSDWPEELKLTDGSLALAAGVDVKFVERNRPKIEARGLIKSESAGKGKKDGRTYWLANEAGTYPKTSPKMGDLNAPTSPITSPILGEVNQQPTTQPPPQPTTEHPPKEGMSPIYIEYQTKDLDLDSLSQKNAGGEILEVEAEEVTGSSFDAEEKKQSPPFPQPPPNLPDAESEEVLAEINEFFLKLSTDYRLIEMLSRLNKIRDQEALGWIEKFVTRQWGGDNLKSRPLKDLRFHCQSWIEDQQAKQKRNEQQPQSTRNKGTYPGSGHQTNGQSNQRQAKSVGYLSEDD